MKLLFWNLSAAIATLGLLALFSSSCQTIDGAGRDIERAGDAIQDAAH